MCNCKKKKKDSYNSVKEKLVEAEQRLLALEKKIIEQTRKMDKDLEQALFFKD